MHLDHFAIIRTSVTNPTVRGILVWEDGQLRVITNDERIVREYEERCSARSLGWTERALPALFPLEALLGPYRMRIRHEVSPMTPNARLRLSAALDELGDPTFDKVLYDERPRKEST